MPAFGLMEREAVDALGLAAHCRQLDSENVEELLDDRLMESLPIVEQRLAALARRRGP